MAISPLSFAMSYNSMKRQWNENVAIYKELVMTFEKLSDNGIRRDLFGAELPQINILTNNATIQIMNNIYDTSKVGFVYKPTLYDGTDELQDVFNIYSKFIHAKSLSSVTNFSVAIKQYIEDAYVLGFGTMLVVPKGEELNFITLKPEYVEFDTDPSSQQPNRFYITVAYNKDHDDHTVFQEVFKTETPKNLTIHQESVDSYAMGDDTPKYINSTKYTIRTWRRKRYIDHHLAHINPENKYHSHRFSSYSPNNDYLNRNYEYNGYNTEYVRAFGKFDFYSYSHEDFELDYCPLIYTRFNVKSNETIGLGRGLESMALIEEIKNMGNALRSAGAYELSKTLLAEQSGIFANDDNSIDTLPINTILSRPIINTNGDGSGGVGGTLAPLELGNNPTITFSLFNKGTSNLTQTFEINRLLVTNPVEMTATEVSVRADRDKRYIDLYVNEFKLAFDLVLRLFFKYYMKDFISLHKKFKKLDGIEAVDVTPLKQWLPYTFNPGMLEVLFLNNNTREEAQQDIADVNSMFDMEMKAISMLSQMGLDYKPAISQIVHVYRKLGLSGGKNLIKSVAPQQPDPSKVAGLPGLGGI